MRHGRQVTVYNKLRFQFSVNRITFTDDVCFLENTHGELNSIWSGWKIIIIKTVAKKKKQNEFSNVDNSEKYDNP